MFFPESFSSPVHSTLYLVVVNENQRLAGLAETAVNRLWQEEQPPQASLRRTMTQIIAYLRCNH